MSVTEQTPLQSYNANGVTTVFPFAFLVLQAVDLIVQVVDALGFTTTKVLNVDYTLSGVGVPAGGTVTFSAAPASGTQVVIFRDTELSRSSDYQDNGDLLADTLNRDLDRPIMIMQEIVAGAKGLPTAATLATDLANTAAAPKGAGLVGYNSGLTYAAGTVGYALEHAISGSPLVTPQQFGAVADGVANDTTAVQAAINAGGVVYFPAGTYLCDTLTLAAGTVLIGAGPGKTTIAQNNITGSSYGTLYCDSGSTSATLDKIVVRGLRLLGKVATLGFSQFVHLASFSGVRDLLIDNVHFVGFRGDGLLIGASPTALTERHNYNVIVRDCVFDGVNNDNRNGISVIDVDGLYVTGCSFKNVTRSTMPGPIDLEPDNLTAYVIRNVKIHDNLFVDCGGNVGSIALTIIQANYTIPQNISICGNAFKGRVAAKSSADITIMVNRNWATTDITMNVVIAENVGRNGNKTVELYGCNGVLVRGNQFTDYVNGGLCGYTTAATQRACNVAFEGNAFYRCGSTGLIGLVVSNTSYADFIGNTFVDSGSGAAGSEHIDFVSGTSSSVRMIGNRYLTPSGMTLIAIQKEGAHTFTASSNVELQESLGALASNFVAHKTDRVVPTLRARRTTDQGPIATGSQTTTVLFNTVDQDNWAAYNAGTGVYTIPVTGLYLVTVTILCNFVSPSGGSGINGGGILANVLVGGARTVLGDEYFNGDPANASVGAVTASGLLNVTAGDSISCTLMTFANVTSSNNIVAGASGCATQFYLRYLGSS